MGPISQHPEKSARPRHRGAARAGCPEGARGKGAAAQPIESSVPGAALPLASGVGLASASGGSSAPWAAHSEQGLRGVQPGPCSPPNLKSIC